MPSIHDHARAFTLALPWHRGCYSLTKEGVVFGGCITAPAAAQAAAIDFNRYLAHEGYLTREQFEHNVALEERLREKTNLKPK